MTPISLSVQRMVSKGALTLSSACRVYNDASILLIDQLDYLSIESPQAHGPFSVMTIRAFEIRTSFLAL